MLHQVAALFKGKYPTGQHYDAARLAFWHISQDPSLADLTAKQVAAHFKGSFDVPNMEDPEKCEATPPAEANCFSDGGFLNPHEVSFGLGGAGLWWPERNLTTQPLHPNETNSTKQLAMDTGLMLWGLLAGPKMSYQGRNRLCIA